MARVLWANLDAEEKLCGARPLSKQSLTRASAYGTLLRVLALPGDQLWTPLPVEQSRLDEALGLPIPPLISGSLRTPVDALLPWSVAPDLPPRVREPATRQTTRSDDLVGRIWAQPLVSCEHVRAANHRGLSLQIASELGVAPPHQVILRDRESLEQTLARQPPDTQWVLKHVLSAAGRRRIFGRGPTLDAHARRALPRLLADGFGLIFEPWLERVDDFAVSALACDDGIEIIASYQQHADWRGRFGGITVDRDGLAPELRETLEGIAHVVGARLAQDGYRGVFSIDAFRYREGGQLRLAPLSEINARLGFGLLAVLLAERGFAHFNWARRCTLRLADNDALELTNAPHVVTVLRPSPPDPSAAWLELSP